MLIVDKDESDTYGMDGSISIQRHAPLGTKRFPLGTVVSLYAIDRDLAREQLRASLEECAARMGDCASESNSKCAVGGDGAHQGGESRSGLVPGSDNEWWESQYMYGETFVEGKWEYVTGTLRFALGSLLLGTSLPTSTLSFATILLAFTTQDYAEPFTNIVQSSSIVSAFLGGVYVLADIAILLCLVCRQSFRRLCI